MNDSFRRPVVGWTALFLVTYVAYVPALFGGFVWDDDQYITNNPTLRDLSGPQRIWFAPRATPQYYPLVFTTFWAERHAWGLHPVGYHLVNIGLHALNAALLWRVLRRLGVPGAWFADDRTTPTPTWVWERRSRRPVIAAALRHSTIGKRAGPLCRPANRVRPIASAAACVRARGIRLPHR